MLSFKDAQYLYEHFLINGLCIHSFTSKSRPNCIFSLVGNKDCSEAVQICHKRTFQLLACQINRQELSSHNHLPMITGKIRCSTEPRREKRYSACYLSITFMFLKYIAVLWLLKLTSVTKQVRRDAVISHIKTLTQMFTQYSCFQPKSSHKVASCVPIKTFLHLLLQQPATWHVHWIPSTCLGQDVTMTLKHATSLRGTVGGADLGMYSKRRWVTSSPDNETTTVNEIKSITFHMYR